MRRSLSAALALVAFSVPAFANGLSGMGEAIHANGFSFPKPNLETVPVEVIDVGALPVTLQRTLLADVVKAFGGSVRSEGEGAEKATWACYTTSGEDAATVWFISNALGGFEFVMMVAAQYGAATEGECDAAPEGFTLPEFGIPGLGAKTDAVKAAFGTASDKGGKIAFRADEPGADALGTSLNAQYIGYLVKGGKVVGLGVGETSVQPPAE